jgi:hypothetical protein
MNCDASISKLIPLEFPIPVCGFMATYLSRTVFPSFSLGFLSTSRNADLALEKMWVMTRRLRRFGVNKSTGQWFRPRVQYAEAAPPAGPRSKGSARIRPSG